MAYAPFDLAGKVALVTGGNSGIGLGMARAMADAGADIAIWGTSADKNAAAKAEIGKTGRKIVTLTCDVGDEAAVAQAFAETVKQMGRVDGCFANAGVSGRGGATSFADMTSAEWHRVTRINLDAPNHEAKDIAPGRPVQHVEALAHVSAEELQLADNQGQFALCFARSPDLPTLLLQLLLSAPQIGDARLEPAPFDDAFSITVDEPADPAP